MNSKQEEILSILQEECAEVIQAVSKVRRFGKENNIAELCQEIADCEYLIKLAKLNIEELNDFNWGLAEYRKFEKLQKFSKIFGPPLPTADYATPDVKIDREKFVAWEHEHNFYNFHGPRG